MKIYVTPNDGSGRVILCESHEEVSQTIEKLKAEGVTEVTRTAGDVICDFCSDPEVRWVYSITPGGAVIQAGDVTHGDADGLWGACPTCKTYIQAGDWDALNQRSALNFRNMHPEVEMPGWLIVVSVEHAHGYFRNVWDGTPPQPVTPDKDFLQAHGIGNE